MNKKRILIDPGCYSIEQHDKIADVDIVLITHEHPDHLHIESLKALVKRSPDIKVITNVTVGEILVKEGIEHDVMEHGDSVDIKGIHIEGFGEKHAQMHSSIPQSLNVGFFIENKFFFPGDAFTDPLKQVDVLALPVSGPWMKLSDAIDYALKLKPRISFPVHDAIRFGSAHILPEKILGANGIEFVKLEEGGVMEL